LSSIIIYNNSIIPFWYIFQVSKPVFFKVGFSTIGGHMQLIHGDCLEKMKDIPDGSIDLVLTDPPYGMDYQSGRRKEKHNKIENDNNLSWLDTFAENIHRITKDNTSHYVFCSFHFIDRFKQALEKHFIIKNILVWEKNNTGSGDLTGDFAPKIEFIIFLQKGRSKIRGRREANIFKFAKTNNELHATQKPVKLLKYLICKFTDEGAVVFDPFMGSGSTGIACLETNRNFIGIELDDHYFNVAKKRIENHELNLELPL